MIINRDSNTLSAEGTILYDIGEETADIENKTYEYYQYRVSAHSIEKLAINKDNNMTGNQTLESIYLLNEPLMTDLDFACVHNLDGKVL
jgi:hypothetical protein